MYSGAVHETRILIVEDESLIAEELKDRLEKLGHEVLDIVATGEEAIARADEASPDLVFMDIRLRGHTDGVEAAATIRRKTGIPVVYLTAHSDEATVARAAKTAPFGFLTKPFAETELRIAVALALHNHEIECRLKESEERYATTLTSIGDAVIATDEDGRITFMNPVAERLTSWRRDDALGRPSEDVVRIVETGTGATIESPIRAAIRESQEVSLPEKATLVRRDGTEIPVDDNAAPILDARKRVRGAVLVFRDITEKLRAQEALRETEERLQHAQRQEVVGRLAGGVAHDFNNLMTIIIGNGELALDALPPDSRARELVQEMKDVGDKAAAITRQLLAFGRKQPLSPKPIKVNDIVHGIDGLLRRVIGGDVRVTYDLESGLDSVLVDPSQMEQIILNLAINARDAMPGGGSLTFETRSISMDERLACEAPDLQPGRYVRLSITDTGIGMSAQTKAHVFEPYFTTKETGKGTGLGLATVYGIVRQSDGYICVDSELGRGTTFRLYFAGLASVASHRDAPERTEAGEGSETILIVEDEPGVRAVARAMLESSGYTVLEAADVDSALAKLEEGSTHIDLVLTDLIMPGKGGLTLLESLPGAREATKILVMSGYTRESFPDSVPASVGFLQKPFTRDELTDKVRALLDG